ncbi:MAG: STAS domain-containing protein [Nocardioidaceae bacterium]
MHVTSGDSAVVVKIRGDADFSSAPSLARKLYPLAGTGRPLVLDLSELGFCGVAVLEVFFAAGHRAADCGGAMLLAAPARPIRRVLNLADCGGLLPTTRCVEEALAALAPDCDDARNTTDTG